MINFYFCDNNDAEKRVQRIHIGMEEPLDLIPQTDDELTLKKDYSSAECLLICKYCRNTFEDLLSLKSHKKSLHRTEIARRREDAAAAASSSVIDDNEDIKPSLDLESEAAKGFFWHQCPECLVLLENRIKFLDHRQIHKEKKSQALIKIFKLPDGRDLTIKELTGYEVFIPKIDLTPLESSCYKYTRLINLPRVQLTKTDFEIAESKRIQLSKRKVKRRFETLAEDCIIDNDLDDEDFRIPSDIEMDKDVEDFCPSTLNSLRRKKGRLRPEILDNTEKLNGKVFVCKLCVPYRDFGTKQNKYSSHVRSSHIVNGAFRCPICSYKRSVTAGTPVKYIMRHIRVHETYFEAGNIVCKFCPTERFSSITDYKIHLKNSHHKSGFYTCPECGFKAKKMDNFINHLGQHYPVTLTRSSTTEKVEVISFSCTLCTKEFRTTKELEQHMERHKKKQEEDMKKRFICTICSAGFGKKEHALRHLAMHDLPNSINPFVCKICNHRSSSKLYLERHLHTHINFPGKYPPRGRNYGTKRFDLKELLLQIFTDEEANSVMETAAASAKLRQSDKKEIPVRGRPMPNSQLDFVMGRAVKKMAEDVIKDNCIKFEENTGNHQLSVSAQFEKYVKQNPDYKKQGRYEHRATPDSFRCKICIASYSRNFLLNRHTKLSHPVEYSQELSAAKETLSLICGKCGFNCPTSEEFANHMFEAHPTLASKNFHCSSCGKRFETMLDLDRHVDMYHNSAIVKTHPCSVCGRKFATENRARSHERRYCTNRPDDLSLIKCKQCGVQKYYWTAYRAHMKIHSADRKLAVCNLCNETCAAGSALRRHIHLVHGGGTYRRNKDKPGKNPPPPIPEDELFL